MSNATVIRAADFISSIGVEAKLNYTDGAYHNISNVLADLDYLGIDLIRAASLNSSGALGGQNSYKVAAAAGIRFDLVVNGNKAIGDTVSQIDSFARLYPGSVYAIEGPNEIDHQPITYGTLSGAAAAVSFQNDLYSRIASDPLLADASVYSFSLGSGATPTGGYTQVALHPYPANGSQPLASLTREMGLAPTGAASVLSETGYSTASGVASGVDQLTQAKLTLNMVFDAAAAGVKTVYLYELLDAYSDPAGSTLSKHYGLFDINNQPKIAATAIHNMMTILSDTGATGTSFATKALSYTLSDASASTLALEKSNGAYDLAVWKEPKIWDPVTHSEIAASATSETINFGTIVSEVKVFDPLAGTSALIDLKNVSSVTVAVTDHPLIVELSGVGAVPSGIGSTSPVAPALAAINIVQGTAASETLVGTAASDIIHGLGGADTIRAGAGDDTIDVGAGKSLIDGGDGFDTISFAGSDSAVKVKLGYSGYQTVNAGMTDNLVSIEGVIGSRFDDIFKGSGGDDRMWGGGGNDSFTSGGGHDLIVGGEGVDTLDLSAATRGVTISLLETGIQVVDTNWTVQLSDVENITGTGFDDTLVAGNSGSVLYGGAGNDMLVGGAGDDQLIGKSGVNTASFASATAGVAVSLALSTVQDTVGAGHDLITGVQNLIGSAFDDVLNGDKFANRIDGGSGNDVIKGGGGADVLSGGEGADLFIYTATADSALGAYDTITDFSHAEGDRLDFSGLEKFIKGAGGMHAFTLVDHLSKSAGQVAIGQESGGWLVSVDFNGDGVADFGLHVQSQTSPVASDFVL